ncbi:MAG: metallophosphoesterase family protein [Solirubrobacteraceae bacterium]
MRVAALYDIHANPVALRAVLAELEREPVDLIVVGGDAVPGPLPGPTLGLLRSLGDRAVFVRGNTDRWTVEEFDARAGTGPDEPRAERPAAAWTATMIDQEQRDFLASFQEPLVIEVDGVGATLFCHGSPRCDDEILTALTPEDRWRPMFAGVEQQLVVCGHTHAQSDRVLGGIRVVNAGSVGMPFEGRAGAFWALLGPDVQLRRTDYDIRAAEAELRGGGWPGVDDFLRNSLLEPADPSTIAESLERQARGM